MFFPTQFFSQLGPQEKVPSAHATVQLMPRRTILQMWFFFPLESESKEGFGVLGVFLQHLRLTHIQVSNCKVEALHFWLLSKQVFGRNTRKPRAFFPFRSFANLAVLMSGVKETPQE